MRRMSGERETRFCKDCKWAKGSFLFGYEYAKCLQPETRELPRRDSSYLVTGSRGGFTYCSYQRQFGQCGPNATLWESKR